MYVAYDLSYKNYIDLNIYNKSELESTFVKIINPKKSNVIVATIYRHPKMDMTKFNHILNNHLKKNNQEQKTVSLLGGFNIGLMHYNEHKPTSELLDSLASNSFLPCIIQSSRYAILIENPY